VLKVIDEYKPVLVLVILFYWIKIAIMQFIPFRQQEMNTNAGG